MKLPCQDDWIVMMSSANADDSRVKSNSSLCLVNILYRQEVVWVWQWIDHVMCWPLRLEMISASLSVTARLKSKVKRLNAIKFAVWQSWSVTYVHLSLLQANTTRVGWYQWLANSWQVIYLEVTSSSWWVSVVCMTVFLTVAYCHMLRVRARKCEARYKYVSCVKDNISAV